MKKFLMNMSAALLVVWYCLSIIGFGVHTCTSSGETFIATFADGVECADIHPEHHCCGASCCSGTHHNDHKAQPCCSTEHHSEPVGEHRGSQSVDTKPCCSNEYQAIALSGCRADNDSDEKYSICKALYPCVIDIPVSYIASVQYYAEHMQFLEHDSGVFQPGDLCVTFGVWRI